MISNNEGSLGHNGTDSVQISPLSAGQQISDCDVAGTLKVTEVLLPSSGGKNDRQTDRLTVFLPSRSAWGHNIMTPTLPAPEVQRQEGRHKSRVSSGRGMEIGLSATATKTEALRFLSLWWH